MDHQSTRYDVKLTSHKSIEIRILPHCPRLKFDLSWTSGIAFSLDICFDLITLRNNASTRRVIQRNGTAKREISLGTLA